MLRRAMVRAVVVVVTATSSVSLLAFDAGAATKAVTPAIWLTNVCKAYSQMTKAVDTAGNTGQLAYANANQSDGAALQAIFQTRFQAQDQAVAVALVAVKKAGTTDPGKVRDAILATQKFAGAEGEYNFDKNGDGLHGYNVVKNEKGNIVFDKHIDFND